MSGPSPSELLDAVLGLGREVHLETDEETLVERFLDVVIELFPSRHLAVRVLDMRSGARSRGYSRGLALRPGIEREPVTLPQAALDKAGLKAALASSARLRVSDRWDPPFSGVKNGFAIPLVASGELYGVVDIAYPMGRDLVPKDEESLVPLANFLSVSLRNERLHRETTLLRDYQARLIEFANALILGVDHRWRITVCNRALCRLLGYQRGELVGRDLRDWLPKEQLSRLGQLMRHGWVPAVGPTDTIDIELPAKDGSSVRTLWSVATIFRRGEVQAVVAIGQDQTKLRELQSQVVQAEKLATLGQLAAGVVHEINNPLTSISVYAEYLLAKAESQEGPPTEDDVVKLRRINEGAQRILNFSRELVQYARPAGDEVIGVHLNHVVRQALWFCEHLFQRSGVELKQTLADELPPIYAVAGQIEQVVVNLVTNAVHACEGPGDVVEVVTRESEGHVELAISDSGAGIPEDDREKVFEPFFSTKKGGQGTGLGLSIVKNIVADHRGTISVTESEHGGALFRCAFPSSDAPAGEG